LAAPDIAGVALPIPSTELALIHQAALEAGEIGMGYFRSKNKVWFKQGNSPVSQADKEIDAHLHDRLIAARPGYGWLSEEREDDGRRLEKLRSFVVDPIDGTRGFIDGKPEWCISVALIEGDSPIVGVLHAPAVGRTFLASLGGGFALEGPMPELNSGTDNTRHKPLITGSKKVISLMEETTGKPFSVHPFIPSLAYRLALVATGELDAAVSRPGASEWDVAAADIILHEAGCMLSTPDGERCRYNQKTTGMDGLFAANRIHHGALLDLAKREGILQKT